METGLFLRLALVLGLAHLAITLCLSVYFCPRISRDDLSRLPSPPTLLVYLFLFSPSLHLCSPKFPSSFLLWQVKMDLLLLMWLIVLAVMGIFVFAGFFILLLPVIDPEHSGRN